MDATRSLHVTAADGYRVEVRITNQSTVLDVRMLIASLRKIPAVNMAAFFVNVLPPYNEEAAFEDKILWEAPAQNIRLDFRPRIGDVLVIGGGGGYGGREVEGSNVIEAVAAAGRANVFPAGVLNHMLKPNSEL